MDDARDQVAAAIGCRPGEVVFTSGGTEGDNAAIAGALRRCAGRAVCPAAEHHAVLHVVERHGGTIVDVDELGRVDATALRDTLEEALTGRAERVGVVSIMAVNNEVGSINDLAALAPLVRSSAPDAVFHTDAVQAAGWLDLREIWPHVDVLTLSAHKFGGPKGVGIAAMRAGVDVDPLIVGGGQERDRRSGTHNVGGIVATAAAMAEADAEREVENKRIGALRDRLVAGVVSGAVGVRETRAPGGQGARVGAPARRGRRQRAVALPARCGRGVRVGGVGLRQRRPGALARARRDGHRSRVVAGRRADDPRPQHHRGRDRSCRRRGGRRNRDPSPAHGDGGRRRLMRVLAAMSGGVDSSVATALLQRSGHEVVGVTMRLWGGDSDTGCCSVSDVDDARRCADALGVEHLVFNLSEEFDRHVVEPYVAAHAAGRTPNPCIECNRRVKFATFAEQARLLGFDAVATGHHARIGRTDSGQLRLQRGADRAKDQSYVVHMLGQGDLARTVFPVGDFDKSEVRRLAAELGLRTADKPDSQDVCFITSTGGRAEFLRRRIAMTPARVVDTAGRPVGTVPAVELVTVGQRKGLGLPGGAPKRFVLEVDRATATVVVGDEDELHGRRTRRRAHDVGRRRDRR